MHIVAEVLEKACRNCIYAWSLKDKQFLYNKAWSTSRRKPLSNTESDKNFSAESQRDHEGPMNDTVETMSMNYATAVTFYNLHVIENH